MRERWVSRMAVATGVLPCALSVLGGCGGDSKSKSDDDATSSTAAESGASNTGGSGDSNTSGSDSDTGGSGGTFSNGSGANDSGGSSAGGSGAVGGSDTAITTGAATTGGSGGDPNDMSGTWDVIVSGPNGGAATATVILSATQLNVDGDLEAVALIAEEVVDIAYEGDPLRASRQSDSDMDLGIMPLPLAGALRFTGVPDDGGACDYSLEPDELSLVCSGEISTPGDLPELENANLTGVRMETLDSVFGDLGGRWAVTAQDLDCSVVFERNTIEVDCAEAGSGSQSVSITVESGRISGSTSGGLEFTAQRR